MQEPKLEAPEELEATARQLAKENAESEPSILRIYWFPHDEEIRLLEIDEHALKHDDDDTIHPFYFRPVEGIPFISGIALVPPSEEKEKLVPPEWGDWSSGVLVFSRNGH